MKNDDLEKTIPIDVLDLEEQTRSAKYKEDDKKVSSRAKKYEDIDDACDNKQVIPFSFSCFCGYKHALFSW